MIKWIKFENFHSYKEECLIDFRVDKKTTSSYFDFQLNDGSKLAKVIGVFGANGAGKSNALRPLAFLSWFITRSFSTQEANEQLPFMPYASDTNEPTSFEIEFWLYDEISDREYNFNYQLVLTQESVLSEKLKIKTSRLYSTVFSREYSDTGYSLNLNKKYIPLGKKLLSNTPSNCSLISFASRIGTDVPVDLGELHTFEVVDYFFCNFITNIHAFGSDGEISSFIEAAERYEKYPEIFEQAKELLRKYDLGISDIVLEQTTVLKENGEEVTKLIPFFEHENNDKTFRLPIFLESSGTQKAFSLLSDIVSVLKVSGIAVLDEFDNELHPQLTLEIIELFKNESTNPDNAQLIFTSHSAETLKLIRKQHVYLTEKVDCESQAWRADEIEGLKERDNLYAKYISGALGGVPEFD